MYKVLWNNMIVDLLREVCYIRYLPRQARAVVVDKGNANGIMGSDKNTMYHLAGTQSTFTEGIKTVEVNESEATVLGSEVTAPKGGLGVQSFVIENPDNSKPLSHKIFK